MGKPKKLHLCVPLVLVRISTRFQYTRKLKATDMCLAIQIHTDIQSTKWYTIAMIKAQIIDQMQKILHDLGVSNLSINLETPTDLSHGDYTTNIAFQASKILKKSPMEVAEEIAKRFASSSLDEQTVDKVEAVKPGFVNFSLSNKELGRNLQTLLREPEKVYVSIKTDKTQFEIYENIGPNTNKPLHIGHLRNGALGVAIVNLRRAIG